MSRRLSNLFAVFILSATLISTAAFSQAQKAPSEDEDPVPVPVEKVDVNSATKAQLMKLPGITDAMSQKIIAGRPYVSKSDLIERKIVPDATYATITNLIVAKPTKPAPANSR